MTRKRVLKNKKITADALREKKYKPSIKESFKVKKKKQYWIAIALVGIFCLVLFMNSYFNYTSGIAHNPDGENLGTRFYFAGPDPYYNMRLCTETLEKGYYPYLSPSDGDPLLNYPAGLYGGARPPLFNMIAVGSTHLVSGITGMEQMEALGWCMLFLPAIYGALLVFPVYGIGKELFGKTTGIIGASFVAIIPAHIASGHGSSFSLFDHDSFLLLLFACSFLFIIKTLKEQNLKKSIGYAVIAGVFVGAIQLTWAAAQVIILMIIAYAIIQFVFDLVRTNLDIKHILKITIVLGISFFISLPLDIIKGNIMNFPLYIFMISLLIFGLYIILNKIKLPWIISLPSMVGLGILGLSFLYMINKEIIAMRGPLYTLSNVIFGEGVYGTKVSLTIGEAHTFPLSQTVMMIGPALYWIGLCGFVLYCYKTFKAKFPPWSLFFIIVFLIQFWLTSTAGRFLNDLIPAMCVFAGFFVWSVIDKIDYPEMRRNIKSIGGFHGIKKGVKIKHIFGVCFVFGLVLVPNTFLALDAATPPEMDATIFGEGFVGSYGTSLGQQYYWADACYWLSLQDTEIENPGDRPGILTWWDYGFYLAAMSEHPTVADNFQNGIQCAANFHTSQSEEESTAILIVRLAEGVKEPKGLTGRMPENVRKVFSKYLPVYTTQNDSNNTKPLNIIDIIEDPTNYAPSTGKHVAEEWGKTDLLITPWNAMYHDAVNIITSRLDDEEITQFYMEMMEVTGYSIRYYGIESRDMTTIFGVFPFLADKSTHGYYTAEDDWFVTKYKDKYENIFTLEEVKNMTEDEYEDREPTGFTERKDAYFNSMAFKTFYGFSSNNEIPSNRIPTYMLKHWKPAFISPYISIAKYYEGAKTNGTVKIGNLDYNGVAVFVVDEYGIPHDAALVQNGAFDVIVPAGNITLSLYIGGNYLDINHYLGTVTEAEATRKEIFNETVNIVVDEASVNVSITGIEEEGMMLNITSMTYPSVKYSISVAKNDTYNLQNMIPDNYNFAVVNSTGDTKYYDSLFVKPNQNEYNIQVK